MRVAFYPLLLDHSVAAGCVADESPDDLDLGGADSLVAASDCAFGALSFLGCWRGLDSAWLLFVAAFCDGFSAAAAGAGDCSCFGAGFSATGFLLPESPFLFSVPFDGAGFCFSPPLLDAGFESCFVSSGRAGLDSERGFLCPCSLLPESLPLGAELFFSGLLFSPCFCCWEDCCCP